MGGLRCGTAGQATLLSSVLLWGTPSLLQQEETEGQSTDLLSSCLCDRSLSVSLNSLCLKHDRAEKGKRKKEWNICAERDYKCRQMTDQKFNRQELI